jgi:hypothetical protein
VADAVIEAVLWTHLENVSCHHHSILQMKLIQKSGFTISVVNQFDDYGRIAKFIFPSQAFLADKFPSKY